MHTCKHSGEVSMIRDDGTFFRKVAANCFDPKERLVECDLHNVGVQVLSTVPVMFNYQASAKAGDTVAKFLNDHIGEVVAKYPRYFIGLGTLPMQSPALAVKELERCVGLGLAGVQIGSNINGKDLSDDALKGVFEAAESLEAAVFIHPWDMLGKKRMEQYWLSWLVGMPAETALSISSMIFGGVFKRFPQLKVAFAHGGGSFPMLLGRMERGFSVRPDLCAMDNDQSPTSHLGKFWLDSLVHDGPVLDYIIDLIGASKICLGSDYPFPLGEHSPGELIASRNYPIDIKEQLFFRSALTWLGRKEEDYS